MKHKQRPPKQVLSKVALQDILVTPDLKRKTLLRIYEEVGRPEGNRRVFWIAGPILAILLIFFYNPMNIGHHEKIEDIPLRYSEQTPRTISMPTVIYDQQGIRLSTLPTQSMENSLRFSFVIEKTAGDRVELGFSGKHGNVRVIGGEAANTTVYEVGTSTTYEYEIEKVNIEQNKPEVFISMKDDSGELLQTIPLEIKKTKSGFNLVFKN